MAEGRRVFSDATQNSQSGCKKLGKHGSRKRAVRRVRYLDPKTSRWLSADPALGEYIPMAPTNDEAKKHNQNLPGMGGIYNTVNFHLYHYAGNNPVKYTDPDGRKTRSEDVQRQIDTLGTKPNTPINDTVILKFQEKAMKYVGNDPEAVKFENSELKKLATDESTMVDSYAESYSETTIEHVEQPLNEQLNYASKKYFGQNTIIDDRNANKTETKTKKYSIRIFTVRNSSPEGESDVYKSFIDFNDDGNIDFIIWENVNLND